MIKHVPLQMLMVNLTNGRRGLFIGVPLVHEQDAHQDAEVQEIWFSDVQELPNHMTLEQLMEMVRDQICGCDLCVN